MHSLCSRLAVCLLQVFLQQFLTDQHTAAWNSWMCYSEVCLEDFLVLVLSDLSLITAWLVFHTRTLHPLLIVERELICSLCFYPCNQGQARKVGSVSAQK